MGKHAEWRKLAKKLRRKRIRTMLAVARDLQLSEEQKKRESSPTYKAWLEEQAVLEEFNAAEEKRLAMQRQQHWEDENEAALIRWREQQSRLAHAKAEKFKREMLIKEEWEKEQRKLQIAEDIRKKAEDEKKKKQSELLAQIDAFIEGTADFPEEVNVSSETQPGHPECPFFAKTGACRFRDSCSRNHIRPGISQTLLVPNFYDHFGLQTLHHDEYDTDVGLEYEESETYQHFKDFYKDVLPEFELCGTVIQFRVCNNEEPHLRGNVYVEFSNRRHSLKAYRTFQGRYYAGRRLNVEFANIPSWQNAVCGLYHKKKCPKGKTCNFLHVFKNPNNAFQFQDHSSSRRQFSRSHSRSPRRRSRSKEWSWSEGSGSDSEQRNRSNSKYKIRSKKYDSMSANSKRRSRSQSKRKGRSRSPAKRKGKNRSRSPAKRKGRSRSPKGRSRSPTKVQDRSKSRSPTKVKVRSRSGSPTKRKGRSKSRSPNHLKNRDNSRDRKTKKQKDRKRNEKHRSKSKSPYRDNKKMEKVDKHDVKRKSRKDKAHFTINEVNGKEDSVKHKAVKENNSKKNH